MNNLVILTTSFPRSKPGSEAAGSFVVDLCESLSKLCRVAIVAPGAESVIERHDRFVVYRYKAPDKPLSEMRLYNPRGIVDILKTLKAGADATRLAADDLNPSAYVALWALPCGFWARTAAQRTGVPFIVWCLGSDIWLLGKIPVVKGLLKRILRSADHVCADGHQLAREVEALMGSRCSFLPTSRNLDSHQVFSARSSAPFRFVFIGRWHPNKGIDLMLEAFSDLGPDDWRLIERVDIYGGGALNGVVTAKVDYLKKMQHPVFLHGYLDKHEAIAAIQNSDWVIIPSRIESIPVIFSDAIQCHRPVICTPVGDLPELLQQNEVGICVDDVNPGAIANGIKQALHIDPQHYSEGMERSARSFNLSSTAEYLLELVGLRSPRSAPNVK